MDDLVSQLRSGIEKAKERRAQLSPESPVDLDDVLLLLQNVSIIQNMLMTRVVALEGCVRKLEGR